MNIIHIASFHYLQTIKNRSLIFLVLILTLIGVIGIVFRIGVQSFIPLPASNSLLLTFKIWNFGGLLFAIFHAAGLFDTHLRQRYFTSSITRPIYFWEYQLGMFLSVFYVYLTICALSLVMITTKVLIYQTPFPDLFYLVLLNKWINAATLIMIVLSLGFVCRKTTALGMFLGIAVLASIFSSIKDPAHPLLVFVKHLLYIITPVERVTLIDSTSSLELKDLLSNALESIGMLLYAGTTLILSNLFYYKKDYPLRNR